MHNKKVHPLGFIGLTDIEVITIEGVAFGADAAAEAVNAKKQT